jgi:hypothetical protein
MSAVWGSLGFGLIAGEARAAPAEVASGAAAETIVVLPLAIEGELPPTWRDQLQSRVIEGMARGRRPVLALDTRVKCGDAKCIRAIGGDRGARWVMRARVTVRDRDFDVALELFDARDGASVTKSTGTCEVCAIAEVGDMLADQAGVLDNKLDALTHAPPVIRFESRPKGALVWIDGRLVGPAPVERTLDEGRHRARAELDDHLPLEVQFDAIAGTRESIALELSPVPKARRRLQQAGWGLFGAGIGLVGGAGIPLLALHGRPYGRRCDGRDVDTDGDCRFRYGTRTGGAVVVAVGAAAIVTGIVLVAVATRRGLPPRRTRARVRAHGLGVAF